MKKIIFTILTICSAIGLVWADEPVCPPAATSTTTISFKRTLPSILPGAFSVSATKQVYFTKGNLQYNPAFNSWRFAEHQYDVIGNAAGNTTGVSSRSTVDAWMDLFAFATSGYDHTSVDPSAEYFQPWESSNANKGDANNDYHYGPSITILTAGQNLSGNPSTANYDWGVYNFTSGTEAGCRTMTRSELIYIFGSRTNASKLYGYGTLFGHKGIFLLPDDWNWDTMLEVKAAKNAADSNIIVDDAKGRVLWRAMEEAGAVFIPCGGWRAGTNVSNPTSHGLYWTSTVSSSANAYDLYFYEGSLGADRTDGRFYGSSVRLVKDVPAAP